MSGVRGQGLPWGSVLRTPPAVQELQETWVRGFHGESVVRTPPAVQELQEMWVRGFHGESVVRTPPAVQELQEMWVRGFHGESVVRTPPGAYTGISGEDSACSAKNTLSFLSPCGLSGADCPRSLGKGFCNSALNQPASL